MTDATALVFGATRGVGLEICRLLRGQGVRVTALVRSTSDTSMLRSFGVALIIGDAMNRADVESAFAFHGDNCLVFSTLSGGSGASDRVDDVANVQVIDACRTHRAERVTLVTSLGCGDTRRYLSDAAIKAFGDALHAKTIAEDHLRESNLAWTIIRPGGLIDDPSAGPGALYASADLHGRISRSDTAALTVLASRRDELIGRALVALGRDSVRTSARPIPVPVLTSQTSQ